MLLKQESSLFKVDLHLDREQSKAIIGGDLILESNNADSPIITKVKGIGAYLSVRGDVIMSAQSDGDVTMNIEAEGTLRLGGNYTRAQFGDLYMDNVSNLIFDGSGSQTIPCSNAPNRGSDEFVITNIFFENASNSSLVLEDTLYVSTMLNLSNGIIVSEATKPLVLKDNASIVGGGAGAYVCLLYTSPSPRDS